MPVQEKAEVSRIQTATAPAPIHGFCICLAPKTGGTRVSYLRLLYSFFRSKLCPLPLLEVNAAVSPCVSTVFKFFTCYVNRFCFVLKKLLECCKHQITENKDLVYPKRKISKRFAPFGYDKDRIHCVEQQRIWKWIQTDPRIQMDPLC